MEIFFENGMRSGVYHISNRYGQANNKHPKSYHPKQESKHILCLDANNLYRYTMSHFLPTYGLKWIEFDLNKYTAISQKDAFSKLIMNILRSYENYIMIIL